MSGNRWWININNRRDACASKKVIFMWRYVNFCERYTWEDFIWRKVLGKILSLEKWKILNEGSNALRYMAFPHITWLWTKDENKPESLSYQRPPISRGILPAYRAHHTYTVSTILIFFTLLIALFTYHIGPLCVADVLFCSMLDTSSLHPTHRL